MHSVSIRENWPKSPDNVNGRYRMLCSPIPTQCVGVGAV